MRTRQNSVFQGKRTRYAWIAFAVALVLTGLCFWLTKPVLLGLRTGPMGGDPQIIVFNPLRNRAPEQAAEFFLESLKAGRCQEVTPAAIDKSLFNQEVCSLEKSYPLTSWRLRDRKDTARQITLFYWYRRKDYAEEDRLVIRLEMNNERWRVTHYNRIY
jgi:hypothetical protein